MYQIWCLPTQSGPFQRFCLPNVPLDGHPRSCCADVRHMRNLRCEPDDVVEVVHNQDSRKRRLCCICQGCWKQPKHQGLLCFEMVRDDDNGPLFGPGLSMAATVQNAAKLAVSQVNQEVDQDEFLLQATFSQSWNMACRLEIWIGLQQGYAPSEYTFAAITKQICTIYLRVELMGVRTNTLQMTLYM